MRWAVAGTAIAGVSGISVNFEEMKNRPVSKVIKLLKDMSKQLEEETEKDQEIYEKMACWCTTNDKEKTKAIADGEAHITDLTAAIEQNSGKSAQLETEKANLEKEIAANQAALDKAKSMRTKQLAEFNAEEKDLLSSIQSMKGAITVLGKHHESFLQMPGDHIANIAFMLKHQLHKYGEVLKSTITPSQNRAVEKFLQAPAYAPASGEIFGIMKNMKDTFESNLEQLQTDEANNQSAFEDLKAAKEEEIKSGNEQFDKKESELATTLEQLANDKVDLEDTRKKLAADEEFLANLKEKCKQTDQEFAARTKARQEEIAGVGKALEYLNSDEAHDLFTRTFNFVQVTKKVDNRREMAAAVLKKQNIPRLNALAVSVRLDAFTKVKKAIDDMIADLKKQLKEESKHRDFCIEELNQNEAQTTKQTRDQEDLTAKKGQLEAEIEQLAKEIEDLKAENAESRTQLKRAGEDREIENVEFQKTVADQKATIALLTKTMEVLKGVFEKSFVQQAPPAGFGTYEQNAGGSGVIAMITQIINDSKAMMAEAVHDEEDAQAAYESTVQETNTSLKTNEERIVNLENNKSTAETDKSDTEGALEDATTELEMLANAAADLHKQCDFFIKNFEVRQTAMNEEIDAMGQAKAILSGAK